MHFAIAAPLILLALVPGIRGTVTPTSTTTIHRISTLFETVTVPPTGISTAASPSATKAGPYSNSSLAQGPGSTCCFIIQDTVNAFYWAHYSTSTFYGLRKVTSVNTHVTEYIDTAITNYETTTTIENATYLTTYQLGVDNVGTANLASGQPWSTATMINATATSTFGTDLTSPQGFYAIPTVKVIHVPAITQANGQLACTTTSTFELFCTVYETTALFATGIYTGQNPYLQAYFSGQQGPSLVTNADTYVRTFTRAPTIANSSVYASTTIISFSTPYLHLPVEAESEALRTPEVAVAPYPTSTRSVTRTTLRTITSTITITTFSSTSTTTYRPTTITDAPSRSVDTDNIDYGFLPTGVIPFIQKNPDYLAQYPDVGSCIIGGPSIIPDAACLSVAANAQSVVPDLTTGAAVTVKGVGCFHPGACATPDANALQAAAPAAQQAPQTDQAPAINPAPPPDTPVPEQPSPSPDSAQPSPEQPESASPAAAPLPAPESSAASPQPDSSPKAAPDQPPNEPASSQPQNQPQNPPAPDQPQNQPQNPPASDQTQNQPASDQLQNQPAPNQPQNQPQNQPAPDQPQNQPAPGQPQNQPAPGQAQGQEAPGALPTPQPEASPNSGSGEGSPGTEPSEPANSSPDSGGNEPSPPSPSSSEDLGAIIAGAFNNNQGPAAPTASAVGSDIVIGSQTLAPGSPAIVISDSTISLAPSASAIVINGQTSPLVAPRPNSSPVITVADEPITANSAMAFIIGSQTLAPGSPAIVISGSSYSLAPSADAIVVNGKSTPLPAATPVPQPVITVGNQAITADSASAFVLGSQTLMPGSPAITVSGSTYSLAPSASAIVVNGEPTPLAPPPDATQVITLPSTTLTANSASQFILAGSTLMPGGSAIVVSGSTYSLAPSASAMVVNGETTPLATSSDAPEVITLPSTTLTANSASQFIIGGSTLAPGGSAITISGSTFSLAPSASEIVVNGQTTPLAASSVGSVAGAAVFTIGSSTITASPVSGGSGYVVGGQTLSPGAAPVTIDGVAVSLPIATTGEIVVGGTTEVLSAATSGSGEATGSYTGPGFTNDAIGRAGWKGLEGTIAWFMTAFTVGLMAII